MHPCCLLGTRTGRWSGSSGQQSLLWHKATGHRAAPPQQGWIPCSSSRGFSRQGQTRRTRAQVPELSLHAGPGLCCPHTPKEQPVSRREAGAERDGARGISGGAWPRLPQHWGTATATWLRCHRSFHSSHSTSVFNHQLLKCSACRQGGGSPFSPWQCQATGPDGRKLGPQWFSPRLSRLLLMRHDPDSGAAPSSAPPPQHSPLQIRFRGQGSPRCCRRDLAGDFSWSAICPGTPRNTCSGGTGGSFNLARVRSSRPGPSSLRLPEDTTVSCFCSKQLQRD